MNSTQSPRTFYVLLVLLIASLLAGGVVLWQRTEPLPPPPSPLPGGGPGGIPRPTVRQTFAMSIENPPGAAAPDARTGNGTARAGVERTDDPKDPTQGRPDEPTAIGMAELHRRLAEIRSKGQTPAAHDDLIALGREIALADFDNAVRLMGAVSDFFSKSALCRGIFELRGVVDPRQAMTAANALDPGEFVSGSRADYAQSKRLYYEALTASMKGWGVSEPEAAAAYLVNVPEEYQMAAAGSVYGAWAERDPVSAARSLSDLSPAIQKSVLPKLYSSWANHDPQGAWSHVLGLPEGTFENRSHILTSIASAWAQTDAAQALSYIDRTLQDDKEYADVVERVTRELASKSPETAAALIVSVPGLYQRQPNLLMTTVRSWVGDNPAAAAAWVVGIQDESLRGLAIKGTAAYWSMRDADAALEWAQSLSTGMDRAYALSNIAATQGQAKTDNVPDWIASLTDEFTRARALSGYVMGRVRRGGDSATSEAIRKVIMSDTIDFVAIQSLIADAKISDADKVALLGLIQ